MNKQKAKIWAAALRSGEYKQGRGSLKSDNGFCCAGVLCQVNGESTLGAWPNKLWQPITAREIPSDLFNYQTSTLNDCGFYAAENESIPEPLTFDEIADLIELEFVHGANS